MRQFAYAVLVYSLEYKNCTCSVYKKLEKKHAGLYDKEKNK